MKKNVTPYQDPEQQPSVAAEPAALYGDINVLKEELINDIMQISSSKLLQRLRHLICREKEEETIGKEEILANIREGLVDIKSARKNNIKRKTLDEFIIELRQEREHQ